MRRRERGDSKNQFKKREIGRQTAGVADEEQGRGVGTFNGVKCLDLRAKRLIERGREREREGLMGKGNGLCRCSLPRARLIKKR